MSASIYFTKRGKEIEDSAYDLNKCNMLTLSFTGTGTPKLVFTDQDGKKKDATVEALDAERATVETLPEGGFKVTFHPANWSVKDEKAHDWHITGAKIKSADAWRRRRKKMYPLEVPDGANDCHGEIDDE